MVRERLKAFQAAAAPLVRADQREFLCSLRDGVEHAVDLNPGVRLLMGIKAVSEPDVRGMWPSTASCGPPRPATRSLDAHAEAAEKADRGDPGQIAALRRHRHPRRRRGDSVEAG